MCQCQTQIFSRRKCLKSLEEDSEGGPGVGVGPHDDTICVRKRLLLTGIRWPVEMVRLRESVPLSLTEETLRPRSSCPGLSTSSEFTYNYGLLVRLPLFESSESCSIHLLDPPFSLV